MDRQRLQVLLYFLRVEQQLPTVQILLVWSVHVNIPNIGEMKMCKKRAKSELTVKIQVKKRQTLKFSVCGAESFLPDHPCSHIPGLSEQ